MEISVEVRTVVCEAKTRVTNCESAEELLDIISQVSDLLIIPSSINTTGKLASSIGIRYCHDFRSEFLKNHYCSFCEHIMRNMNPRFLNEKQDLCLVLQALFLNAPAGFSFLALVSILPSTNHTAVLSQIVAILNKFISHGKFEELFYSNSTLMPGKSSIVQSQDILKLLVSLPDQLANKMKLNLEAKFHPTQYFKMLGKVLVNTLSKIHDLAINSQEFTTTFLSTFVGKVALRGSVDMLLDEMLPKFKVWSYTSPLWSTLCSQVLMDVPVSALEPVVESILKKVHHYPFFCKLFKDSVYTNQVFKMLITHKFLFVRYYRDVHILKNIIGYLCGEGKHEILMETAKKLLSHWSNNNTIKHSSYLQHLYITQAVILSLTQVSESEVASHKHELLNLLLSGVQAHLESPNSQVRQLGMVTAECITSCLHPAGNQKLQFEYEENDEISELRELAALPKFGGDLEKLNVLDKLDASKEVPKMVEKVDEASCLDNSSKDVINDDEDDLEPFEMSENDDNLIEGIHPPRYISDCIDGLLASDDYKRYTASLRVLNKVIIEDKDNLPHQSVQLVTILLHLQDKYALDDYCSLRFAAMVSATVTCPVQVSEYLTKEFYAANYNLRQRMDILDVLAAAAAELSKPTTNKKVAEKYENIPSELKNWQLIIQERVEKKTRRFGKSTAGKGGPVANENSFAKVAGHFFFPLLQNFDCRQNTFDLLGEDCMVLGSLICTLGNVIHCAHGVPVACNMAKCILEFVWVMRYHDNAHIRQALLFALAMAVLSVPGFFLFSELQDELVECQNWLENIVNNDSSAECRKLAMQVLMSVRNVFEKELKAE